MMDFKIDLADSFYKYKIKNQIYDMYIKPSFVKYDRTILDMILAKRQQSDIKPVEPNDDFVSNEAYFTELYGPRKEGETMLQWIMRARVRKENV